MTSLALRPASDVASRPLPGHLFQEAYHDLALVIDLRAPEPFAEAHVPGAICLPADRLGRHLGPLARLLLPPSAPLLLVGSDHLAQSAGDVLTGEGFSVLGYLDGGMTAWKRGGRISATFPHRALPKLPREGTGALFATSASYPWSRVAEPSPSSPVEAYILIRSASLTPSLARWLKAAKLRLRERASGAALWVTSPGGVESV